LKKLLALMVVLFVAALALASPASAVDHNYQVPSDGSTHAIVGSEPTLANAGNDGCHVTATYDPTYTIPQKLVFCVWIGVKNTVFTSSWEDDLEVAIKWRCYDGGGSADVCGDVNITANWSYRADPTDVLQHAYFYATCSKNGWDSNFPDYCMGYSGSGTYTNNSGWLHPNNPQATVVGGRGTNTPVWAYIHGFTSNEYFDGYSVGQANTSTWSVTDTW
jgi:hypothetical protein